MRHRPAHHHYLSYVGASGAGTPLSPPSMDSLVQENATLVRQIAQRLHNRLPASIEVDDLIQIGMIGLIEAAQNYFSRPKKEHTAAFPNYASLRIRGAMIDHLRRLDPAPRLSRQRANKVEQALFSLEAKLGREPSTKELCDHLAIDKDTLHQWLNDTYSAQVMYFNDMHNEFSAQENDQGMDLSNALANTDENDTPEQRLEGKQIKTALANAIATLNEREQLVLSLCFEQDLSQAEVAKTMNLSEGRISQLKASATVKIRRHMQANGWSQSPDAALLRQANLSP